MAEKGHNPGRVAVMKIPDHVDVRSKNMFNLADASIFWQKSGENLAFKVERYGKKKEEKDEVKYSVSVFIIAGVIIPSIKIFF